MRHIFSAGHYVDEEPLAIDAEDDLQDAQFRTQAGHGKHNGSEAWDIYYAELVDFANIKQLMHTALPYCIRLGALSPLVPLALHQLRSETQLLRPLDFNSTEDPDSGSAGFALEGPSKTCWSFLEACQDAGAIARQEAASMLPVLFLQVPELQLAAESFP